MLQTWDADSEKRPTFSRLVSIMGDFLEANVKQVCLLIFLLVIESSVCAFSGKKAEM